MAINKVILGDQTLIDLTADSVTPDKLFKGITAHNMKGESIVGTMEGGSTPSEPTDNTAVIFADYDGNLIDTWTKDEVASKTTLPTPPTHSGLVFEGWNWTLEDIQTDTTGQVITVGPYYHTESGYSEYDVEVSFQRGMTMALNTDKGRYSYIDWGDGTVITEAVEDNPSHTYSQAGNYTIKIALKGVQGKSIPQPDYNIKAVRYGVGIQWKNNNTSAEYVTIPSDMVWNYGSVVFSNAKQITAPKDALQDYYIKGKNLIYVAMVKEVVTAKAKSSFGCGQKSKYVYIPSSVTSIGQSAFQSCSSLQSVNIPSNVTSIGSSAFYGCGSLQSITIPSSVTSIGNSAFYGCGSLQSITIPSSVISIGQSAFYGCSSLQSVNIPSSVISIGNSAFYGCSSLQSITIPSSVTSIGNSAFYGCSSLQSITIPENVTSIGDSAFQNCSSLQSITIPENVTSIGQSAFRDCSSLQSVNIPENVTSIGQSAFHGCSSLQSITIPENVTSIGNSAFHGCSSLQSVTIPSNVTSIGNSAFYGCSSLQSVNIPSSVISIGDSAFNQCSSIYFAEIKSDAKIGSTTYNFYGYKCRYDFRYCTSVPILSSSNGLNPNLKVDFIIVPDALYDEWIAATNWVAYASKIKKASEV